MSAAGALVLGLAVAGCSAVNLTGFSMPVFGLTKKSDSDADTISTSSIPSDPAQTAGQQSLSNRY